MAKKLAKKTPNKTQKTTPETVVAEITIENKVDKLFSIVSDMAKIIGTIQSKSAEKPKTEDIVAEEIEDVEEVDRHHTIKKPTKKSSKKDAKSKKVNLFDSMPEFNMNKAKKKSEYDWEPTPRRKSKKEIVITCDGCKQDYTDIYKPEQGQPKLCNSCLVGKRLPKNRE